jgi:hypothetical protein
MDASSWHGATQAPMDSANIVILRRISTINGLFGAMTPESQRQRKVHPISERKMQKVALFAQGLRAKRAKDWPIEEAAPSHPQHPPCGRKSPIRYHTTPKRAPCGPQPVSGLARRLTNRACG